MKTPLWIAPAALVVVCACGSDNAQEPSAPAAETPALESEEELATPEEEAAKAAETIDEGNAEAELQKLEQELGGG